MWAFKCSSLIGETKANEIKRIIKDQYHLEITNWYKITSNLSYDCDSLAKRQSVVLLTESANFDYFVIDLDQSIASQQFYHLIGANLKDKEIRIGTFDSPYLIR